MVQNCFIENSPHVEMFHCNVGGKEKCVGWMNINDTLRIGLGLFVNLIVWGPGELYTRNILWINVSNVNNSLTLWPFTPLLLSLYRPDICLRPHKNLLFYSSDWLTLALKINFVIIVSPWHGGCLRPHKNLLFDSSDWLTLELKINLGSKWA